MQIRKRQNREIKLINDQLKWKFFKLLAQFCKIQEFLIVA